MINVLEREIVIYSNYVCLKKNIDCASDRMYMCNFEI